MGFAQETWKTSVPATRLELCPTAWLREEGSRANCDQKSSRFEQALSQRIPTLPLLVLLHSLSHRGGHTQWGGVTTVPLGTGGPRGEAPLKAPPFLTACLFSQGLADLATQQCNCKAKDNSLASSLLWHMPFSSKCLEVKNTVETHLLCEVSIVTSGISTSDAFVYPKSKLFSRGQPCIIPRAERRTQLIHFPP